MSRHFAVLGKTSAMTSDDSPGMQSSGRSCEYTELIQRLFQGPSVVAVIGSSLGHGVTGICEGIASELSRQGRRVVLVSVNALLQSNPITLCDEAAAMPRVGRNVWLWPSPAGQQAELFRPWLKDPEITLVLKEFEKPYFVVGGEVTNPGKFEMRGQITAIQAIAMAGGFKTISAKHSQVILFRRVGPDLAKTEILNLKAAMSPTATEALADLRSGDMLIVPQNHISKIERVVKLSNIGLGIPVW